VHSSSGGTSWGWWGAWDVGGDGGGDGGDDGSGRETMAMAVADGADGLACFLLARRCDEGDDGGGGDDGGNGVRWWR
jgi:hypothetical protein